MSNTKTNRAAIFANFMAMPSYTLDRLVGEAIELPGIDVLDSYVSSYFSPTSRKEDWDVVDRYIARNNIKLGSSVWRGKGSSWLTLPGESGIGSFLGKVPIKLPKDDSYWGARLLSAVGLSEKWDAVLEDFNEAALLESKSAALLTAVELLKEKAAAEESVQGELVSVTPTGYRLEALYRLPGEVYRIILERKEEGTEARVHETVFPKFRDFLVKKPA